MLKLLSVAVLLLYAATIPVPLAVELFIMMLFLKNNCAVVDVVDVVCKIPLVPKFAPLDVAVK